MDVRDANKKKNKGRERGTQDAEKTGWKRGHRRLYFPQASGLNPGNRGYYKGPNYRSWPVGSQIKMAGVLAENRGEIERRRKPVRTIRRNKKKKLR